MQVSRNPFARTELHRELVPINYRGKCKWCGQTAKFAYYIETDGGRTHPILGEYCSISCCRSYNS